MRQQRARRMGIAVGVLWSVGWLAYLVGAPATFYTAVATEATRLMPSHFKSMLGRRQDNLQNGINNPYLPHLGGESKVLIEQIEAQVQNLKTRLSGNVPFNALAAEYGNLARWVAELEDPARGHPGVPSNAQLRREFHALIERKYAKLPVVFYGYDATLFKDRNLKPFLEQIAQRAQFAGERLAQTYVVNGQVKALANADDRSPAFAAAALYYSHTISDVANIWLYIWWEAYGDMRGTPFFDTKTKP